MKFCNSLILAERVSADIHSATFRIIPQVFVFIKQVFCNIPQNSATIRVSIVGKVVGSTMAERSKIELRTARQVESVGPGRYTTSERRLYLHVTGNSRRWLIRYTINGKAREMGIGPYPAVSFAQAKVAARQAAELLFAGIDPLEHRQQAKVESDRVPTFTRCAALYIRAHRHGWKNPKHARQWVSTIKTYARPVIGAKKVDSIATEHVLEILSPIWTSKTETAKRVQGRIENILDYAAAHKWRDPLNPARWRGHLDKLLPKPAKVKTARHHPAMPYADVPGFMAELAQQESISALALRFLILTATRTNEVLNARWSEVDLDNAVWIIPAERMKAKQEHRVPLSDTALAVLNALPKMAGNPYVFIGTHRQRPLSNMALLQLMRGLGYGVDGKRGNYVPHGFRSSFRDWTGEVSSFPRDVAEMALAHVIENKAEAAYRRGDLFNKRRLMMQAWCDFATKTEASVTLIHSTRKAGND